MFPDLQREDDSEFEMLMKSHRTGIHAYLIAIMGNRADAEDVLQSVMIMAWEKRDEFEPGTHFAAWLRTIAWFQAQNAIRKRATRSEILLIDESMMIAVDERLDEREAEFTRHRRALRFCLDKLPERQRIAVELRFFSKAGVDEIAQEMGVKANAVSQLIFRAKSSLMDCVKRESRSGAESLR